MSQLLARIRTIPTPMLGALASCVVLLIWSGWYVSSRWGIVGHISPVDLTGLRFLTAAVLTLPFSLTYHWRGVNFKKALVAALTSGFPYTLLAYFGFKLIPSANASVLINGFLPVVTCFLGAVFFGYKIDRPTISLLLVILIATALMAWSPDMLNLQTLFGVLLLLLATAVLSIYVLVVKQWGLVARDILAWVPLLNAILFLPIWLLFRDPGLPLASVPLPNLLFHLAYQGALVSVVGFLMFSFVIRALGPVKSSIVMALIPTITALMAIPLLGEIPTLLQWCGIALCSGGLMVYPLLRK